MVNERTLSSEQKVEYIVNLKSVQDVAFFREN